MNLAIATSRLPGDYVNPNYFDDLSRRVSVAHADGTTYAFDDRCTHEASDRIGERWLSLTV
jgi:nitrite reductase/ring-hydroxylating ferredoxin subunit